MDYSPFNVESPRPVALQSVAYAFLAPPFAGWSAHLLLYGAAANAFFNYVSTSMHKADSRSTKVLLYTVFILETVCIGVNYYEVMHYGTSQNRDAESLFLTAYIDTAPLVLLDLIGTLVQIFFTMRCAKLFAERKVLRYTFIGVMLFLIFMAALAGTGAAILNILIAQGREADAAPFTYNNLTGTYLWIEATIDVAISSVLVIRLRAHFKALGKQHLNVAQRLQRLLRVSLRTAAVTSIFACCGALIATIPLNGITTINGLFAFTLPMPALYFLSFIYTLSSRGVVVENTQGASAAESQLPVAFRPHRVNLGAISMHVETVIKAEREVDYMSQMPRRGKSIAEDEDKLAPPRPWERERDTAQW